MNFHLLDLSIMVTGLSNSFFANKALSDVATIRILKMISSRGKNPQQRTFSWLHLDYVSFTNEPLVIIIIIISYHYFSPKVLLSFSALNHIIDPRS